MTLLYFVVLFIERSAFLLATMWTMVFSDLFVHK
jgi:hypothetical protein